MLKAIDKWMPGYLASHWRRPRMSSGLRHLMVCVADHFEPIGGQRTAADAPGLVETWLRGYAERLGARRDADGVPPRHTFFFPAETYQAECLDRLGDFCRSGLGELEVHLHHRNDTAEGLQATLSEQTALWRRQHGLLGQDGKGRIRYGFVHGNWALCNARPDGDWCGVNKELSVLSDTGCYADFTFPSAPSPTQPRIVNAVYRAVDRVDGGPRSQDQGSICRVSGPNEARQGLLLVQGPLALDWRRRKFGCLPRLDNGELSGVNPPSGRRQDLWVRQHIHVQGRPDWVFVKLHTHGCVPANQAMILGAPAQTWHDDLARRYNDGVQWQLHYVSARELCNIVLAAEDGRSGHPNAYRDYCIQPPPH